MLEVYISSTTTLLTNSSSPVNYPKEEAPKHPSTQAPNLKCSRKWRKRLWLDSEEYKDASYSVILV